MAITTHGGTTDAADKLAGVVPIVSSAGLERTPPTLTLAAQVERLEFQSAQLNEMLGETIATIIVNLDRGNIRTCDQESEKNLRAFLDSRSKWREQLMCSNAPS